MVKTSLARSIASSMSRTLATVSVGPKVSSVTAIESRDPTTSGHSGRVAILTVNLAAKVDALDAGAFRDVRFTQDQLQEIRYASLLHDFGKVGVREKVLIVMEGRAAGEALGRKGAPVDAAIIGIIDSVDVQE